MYGMPNKKFSYYNDISMMMFGFGDSHEPNPETVRLVESIVLRQLRMIVNEAQKYWDHTFLKGEDLIFLLRHNKHKMQRLIRYIQYRDRTKRLGSSDPSVIVLDEIPKNKLIDFIEKIDETGEFMDLTATDDVKMERLIRADWIAQELDEKNYLEFQKARCASFKGAGAGLEHIRHWIDPRQEINFKPEALEVLSYFARQTVAEIMDFALIVREDAKAGTDPVRHLPGSYYTSNMFNCPHRYQGTKYDYTRIRSGQRPISVNEIKEVMRRLYSPQAGKLNFGGKVPDTHYIFVL